MKHHSSVQMTVNAPKVEVGFTISSNCSWLIFHDTSVDFGWDEISCRAS